MSKYCLYTIRQVGSQNTTEISTLLCLYSATILIPHRGCQNASVVKYDETALIN